MTSALTTAEPIAVDTISVEPAPARRPARRSRSSSPKRRPYLAPVPDCEPPFDDERAAARRIQQLRPARVAALAGTGMPTARTPTGSATALLNRVVPDTVTDKNVPGWSQEPDIGVRRTTTAELPPAEKAGQVLARALVEVLCGQRQLAQLRVHCAPEVFAGLQGRNIVRGALGHLTSVRACEPADGAAEITAVFRRGTRVRALAFRIQGVDGRWRVTALQTG